ncbi:MAG: long-chain fatty acid--CoA ligase [Antricoccus sp.]
MYSPQTSLEVIDHHAKTAPDRPAVGSPSKQLTYEQLRSQAAQFRTRLVQDGVQRGDRVLLVCPTVPEFPVAYFAILGIGAIAVTVNTMSTIPELSYFVADAGCTEILAWHESAKAAVEVANSHQIRLRIIEPIEPSATSIDETAVSNVAATDTAVLIYTSGTTGRPKGAMLTHANLVAVGESYSSALKVTPEDRFGTALPLFHVFGQGSIMNTVFRAGGMYYLLPKFDPISLLEAVRDEQLTVLAGVPTMWNAMMRANGSMTAADIPALRLAVSGGASLPAEIIRGFKERFGALILEGYGLSETTGGGTCTDLSRPPKIGYVGMALPGSGIKIVGTDGNELPTGEVGEILLRGPMVMSGYWNKPEATAKDLRDGWFHTGDLGSVDQDGDLRIVDRLKELIIRGGYNVYPREVEEVLYEHPDVREVAVIGVPDEHFGEEILAVLALEQPQSFDADAMTAWIKERLSAYKVPRRYRIVDELPKGPTGKILKRAIKPDEVAPD